MTSGGQQVERRPNGGVAHVWLTAIFAEVVVFSSREAADLDFGRCDRKRAKTSASHE